MSSYGIWQVFRIHVVSNSMLKTLHILYCQLIEESFLVHMMLQRHIPFWFYYHSHVVPSTWSRLLQSIMTQLLYVCSLPNYAPSQLHSQVRQYMQWFRLMHCMDSPTWRWLTQLPHVGVKPSSDGLPGALQLQLQFGTGRKTSLRADVLPLADTRLLADELRSSRQLPSADVSIQSLWTSNTTWWRRHYLGNITMSCSMWNCANMLRASQEAP